MASQAVLGTTMTDDKRNVSPDVSLVFYEGKMFSTDITQLPVLNANHLFLIVPWGAAKNLKVFNGLLQ